ncbi:hypothetical protein K501DRAFT_324204 [Backusella circina FSU 941]|nr:hypothetical protein K501DRAFT_324204 [Backusella circina FSU 941]
MSFKLNKLKNKNKETPSPTGSFGDAEYQKVIDGIKRVYRNKIKPLEVTYNFEGFHSAPLTDSDIEAKPIVLLLGQYSTGKTTFIRHLLDKSYPGEHIGVEPTTDRFVAVMHGDEDRVIPGNAAAVNQELPFRGLNRFGQAFLSRFQVSQTNSPVLENMTLIDTPGILAGDKQNIERGYDFTQVIEWYAERADLILLMFDSHKLDISNEFRMAIQALRGKEEKMRVILNKSDMVSQQQLMRVYGAMMWSLGKVIQTPEVVRVYISSFWVERPPNCFEDCRELVEMESKDLLRDLKELRRNAAVRKINEIVKRARLAKVHALIISHLKKEMPAMFGKKKKQGALLNHLDQEFAKIQQKYHLPAGDFPNPERFRQNLTTYDLDKFKSLKEDLIEKVDEATSTDFPNLLTQLPVSNPELDQQQRNPFDTQTTTATQNFWDYNAIDISAHQIQFNRLNPRQGKLPGAVIKPVLVESGLPNDLLAHIWRLSDYDNDGYMDIDEFSIAMHLIKAVKLNMLPLPEKLPPTLMPNRKL